MAVERFEMRTLIGMDAGRISEAFEQALARCEADCKDRPAVKKPRKVALSAEIVPVIGPDGSLESCDVTFQIKDAVPTRESKTYNMKSSRAGLLFNEMSPEDVHQRTLDEAPHPRSTSNAS